MIHNNELQTVLYRQVDYDEQFIFYNTESNDLWDIFVSELLLFDNKLLKYKDIFKTHYEFLNDWVDKIKTYIDTLTINGLEFNKYVQHKNLDIYGHIDCLSSHIIHFKFSDNIDMDTYITVFLQHFILNPTLINNYFEIYNFLDGTKYNITFKKSQSSFEILTYIGSTLNLKLKNLCFAYDLETTGLISTNNYPDITERHFFEINTKSIVSTGIIKPIKILEEKDYQLIQTITGITKNDLINGQDINIFKSEIKNILEISDKPTFIAYNGNTFDHKILIHNSILNYETCNLLDSLVLTRHFIKQKPTSFKLSEIFKLLFPNDNIIAHRAEADVYMMVKIMEEIGITLYL